MEFERKVYYGGIAGMVASAALFVGSLSYCNKHGIPLSEQHDRHTFSVRRHLYSPEAQQVYDTTGALAAISIMFGFSSFVIMNIGLDGIEETKREEKWRLEHWK